MHFLKIKFLVGAFVERSDYSRSFSFFNTDERTEFINFCEFRSFFQLLDKKRTCKLYYNLANIPRVPPLDTLVFLTSIFFRHCGTVFPKLFRRFLYYRMFLDFRKIFIQQMILKPRPPGSLLCLGRFPACFTFSSKQKIIIRYLNHQINF